jgi:hypothetical protein
MTYIWILCGKYPQEYLETLHSHFQPNCHFKMFKNSGSGMLLVILRNCRLPYNSCRLFFHWFNKLKCKSLALVKVWTFGQCGLKHKINFLQILHTIQSNFSLIMFKGPSDEIWLIWKWQHFRGLRENIRGKTFEFSSLPCYFIGFWFCSAAQIERIPIFSLL